ncbi:MAG TPA: DUF1801 domain-containing protein [Bryobacteraceae bacterium]|nr:DUF1801 domain-containing protein [Bryobacteraceae bacterium]
MKNGAKEVDDYLARVPEPARSTLNKIRAAIRAAAPAEATEGLSYGMPAFRYNGPLVGYAAFSNHCGLYPMNPAVIVEFRDELQGYETSKGTIRFPVDRPLPAALVKKLVKARVRENERKGAKKRHAASAGSKAAGDR